MRGLAPIRRALSVDLGRKRLLQERFVAGGGRTFSSDHNTDNGAAVTLYQYQICPFCNKVKALLNYTKTRYTPIEVNPLTKAEIKWSKDYRKVPIATINGKPYFGSDEIVHGLLESNTAFVTPEFNGPDAKRWQEFCNNELAPLLYPNMCGTWSDSFQAFGYIHQHPQFSSLQKVAIQTIGSFAMKMAASKVKKRRGITDERDALEQVLHTIEIDGLAGGSNDLLSGRSEPHLGDLAIYGTLRSIEGLPAHAKVVLDRGGPLQTWYSRMKAKVED